MNIPRLTFITGLLCLVLFSCQQQQDQPVSSGDVTTENPVPTTSTTKVEKVIVQGEIDGIDPANGPQEVGLFRFVADKFDYYSAAKLDQGRFFVFELDQPFARGLYQLRLKGARPLEFVVGDTESQIQISATYPDLVSGVSINSRENEAYLKALKLVGDKVHDLDSLKNIKGHISRVNKKYYTLKDEYREQINETTQKYNAQLAQLQKSYPNTFTTEVLIPIFERPTRLDKPEWTAEYDNDHAFDFYNYFANVNFESKEVLNHPAFWQELKLYLQFSKGEFKEDYREGADIIMSQIGDNKEVAAFVSEYFTYYYVDLGMDDVADYIAQKYIEGCTEDYIETLKKKERFSSGPAEGSYAPDFMLPDEKGTMVKLSDVVFKSSMTIVYFWRSDCPYCLQETPNMIRLAELYHDKGLNIVAVSLDKDRATWMNAIKDKKIGWVHLNDMKGGSSGAVDAYSVSATPGVFLVNSNGKIVSKGLKGPNLRGLLEQFFAGLEK